MTFVFIYFATCAYILFKKINFVSENFRLEDHPAHSEY